MEIDDYTPVQIDRPVFEKFYGLNPNNPSDANLDSDGDGLTNLQEFKAGTNPLDANSALRITAVAKNGNDFVGKIQSHERLPHCMSFNKYQV